MRRCPNCESRVAVKEAARAIRTGNPIRCESCDYSLRLSRTTRILSFLMSIPMLGGAIVGTELVFTWIRWLPGWLGLAVFLAIFFVGFQLCCRGLACVAQFTHCVAPHHCTHCQYDIRSTSTTICPECGEPFSPADPHGDDDAIA